MSKFCASVNSDLGNGSFWVEIGEAEHVDWNSWKCTRVSSHQLTSDLKSRLPFWKCLQCRVWKQFRCLRLSKEACGAPTRSAVLVTAGRLGTDCGWSWTVWNDFRTSHDGEVASPTSQTLGCALFRCLFDRIPYRFWPRTVTIGFYGKKSTKSELVIFESSCLRLVQFSMHCSGEQYRGITNFRLPAGHCFILLQATVHSSSLLVLGLWELTVLKLVMRKISKNGCFVSDVDECVQPSLNDCDVPPKGKCHNVHGSFVCRCLDGYRMCQEKNKCEGGL